MNPIRTPGCNHFIGGVPAAGADGLPVEARTRMYESPEGKEYPNPTYTSYWKPDELEREIIAAGGHVTCTFFGKHPHVEITATPDFKRNPDEDLHLVRLMAVAEGKAMGVNVEDLQKLLSDFQCLRIRHAKLLKVLDA